MWFQFFFFLLVTFCVELSAGVWRIVEFDLSYNRTDVLQLKANIDFYVNLETVPSWFEEAWIEIHNRVSQYQSKTNISFGTISVFLLTFVLR